MLALVYLNILMQFAAVLPISSAAGLRREALGQPISQAEKIASKNLTYEEEDHEGVDVLYNSGKYDGDIMIDTGFQRNALVNEDRKWPNGIIPYIISADFDSRERKVIARAFSILEEKTCLRIQPRTTESAYVSIIKSSGCWRVVGRSGSGQPLSIGNGCANTVIVLHEFMHAAGFYHEQSRTDRDTYVRINFENIQPGKEGNFRKYSSEEITDLGAPYDYCSIMHYGAKFFSKNGEDTITTIKPTNGCVIGETPYEKDTLSEIDMRKLNTYYQCKGLPQISTPDDIIGVYTLSKGPSNNWHYVVISKKTDGTGYKWTNRAGVSWSLTYRGKSDQGFHVYNVGTDSPYYTFADGEKYRTPTLFERNGVTEIQGPGYALYKKGEPINPAGQSPDDIIGDYTLSSGPSNSWHYVKITKNNNGQGYTWTNQAGRSWTLTYKEEKSPEGFNVYSVGSDSPYYTFAGGENYRSPTLFVNNGVTQLQGPFYELYTKNDG